jgi:succinoglycan biosynthesis protein ExoW
MGMSDVVAVVVPYFQRQPGILVRTLDSVFGQQGAPSPHVLIVDDGSPVPAASEINALDVALRSRITLLCQPNRGPGAARNAGLAAVPQQFTWVALLDSDDIWHEQHLARALAALHHGYDFFFANNVREGGTITTFEASGFDQSQSQPIDAEHGLFAFHGDLFTNVVSYTPISTSTVVLRKSVLGHLRFTESIRTCEDLLFWVEVAKSSARIAFGREVQVTFGKGLNIFASIVWNSNEALQQAVNFSVFYDEIARRFPLLHWERTIIRRKKVQNRECFVRAFLSMLRSGSAIDLAICREFVRQNPAVFADLVRIVASEVVHRTFSRPV